MAHNLLDAGARIVEGQSNRQSRWWKEPNSICCRERCDCDCRIDFLPFPTTIGNSERYGDHRLSVTLWVLSSTKLRNEKLQTTFIDAIHRQSHQNIFTRSSIRAGTRCFLRLSAEAYWIKSSYPERLQPFDWGSDLAITLSDPKYTRSSRNNVSIYDRATSPAFHLFPACFARPIFTSSIKMMYNNNNLMEILFLRLLLARSRLQCRVVAHNPKSQHLNDEIMFVDRS